MSRPKFREGDRVIVEAVVGIHDELVFHQPLKDAKMVRPKVEVGDHLYECSYDNEDNVSPGGEVLAVYGDKAWVKGHQGDELVVIGKQSRVIPKSQK